MDKDKFYAIADIERMALAELDAYREYDNRFQNAMTFGYSNADICKAKAEKHYRKFRSLKLAKDALQKAAMKEHEDMFLEFGIEL